MSISIDDQIQGAVETLMYLELDNANKVDRKLYDEKHAVERINIQRAIVTTLHWLRDHKNLIVAAREMLKSQETDAISEE